MSKNVAVNRYKADLREIDTSLRELGRRGGPLDALGLLPLGQGRDRSPQRRRRPTGMPPRERRGERPLTGSRRPGAASTRQGGSRSASARISAVPGRLALCKSSSTKLLAGANVAFAMYPLLTYGAAELIEAFGTAEQKSLDCERMYTGAWGGTMCLTEPQAGSDVGMVRTRAERNADGTWRITGTKIFSIYEGTNHIQAVDLVGRKPFPPAPRSSRRGSRAARWRCRR
jgi:hypothetical protein